MLIRLHLYLRINKLPFEEGHWQLLRCKSTRQCGISDDIVNVYMPSGSPSDFLVRHIGAVEYKVTVCEVKSN